MVKNPAIVDQALISPQRGGVSLLTPNGIMEWWNDGILGMMAEPVIFDLAQRTIFSMIE
jgi:hypothetical protein